MSPTKVWQGSWVRRAASGVTGRGRDPGSGRRIGSGRLRPVTHENRIVRDPAICGGEPVFRTTRVTLRTVLASLAEGATPEEIIADFPTLTMDDVRAAIAFAAASAAEDLPTPEVPRLP